MGQIKVAIVIPAYNAARTLPRVLSAALTTTGNARVIVVDPGSTDATSSIAKSFGVEVVRLPERAGPAEARNIGVEHVDEDVVLFIDSDCVAHRDVVLRVSEAFSADSALVSLTGSYDADPPERNFFSQYMNLRHHFTHQRARTDGASFWAGCGAVRRSAFVRVGGFDALRFPRPMIEDIDLGLRLAELGRTCLDPALQVTHLKRWTARSVVETDILCRALPWGRLILETGIPNDLNLRFSQRVAAALAPAALAGIAGALAAVLLGNPVVLALSLVPLCLSLILHQEALRFFNRVRGPRFAIGYWLFQQVHLSYSAATMAVCVVLHLLDRRSARPSAGA